MSQTEHRYVVRMEMDGGKVVTSQMETMAVSSKRSLEVIEGSATRVDSRLSLMATTVMTRLIPAFSASAFGAAIGKAVRDLADLQDAADKVGISAEKLQVFRYLGEEVGIGAASAEDAIAKYYKLVGEAQMGTGKLLDTLERYNIELKDVNGNNRDALDILSDLSDVISHVKDEQVQLAIAQKAGLEGFVANLRKGSEGLREFEETARQSGWIIDENLIKRADEFDERWERSMRLWSAKWKSAALEASIVLADFIKDVNAVNAQQIAGLRQFLSGGSAAGDVGYNAIPADILANWKPTSADTPEGRLKQQASKLSKTGFTVNSNGGAIAIETRTKQQIEEDNEVNEKSVDIAQKHAEKISEVIKALQFKNEQMMRNALEQEYYNQLQAAGISVDHIKAESIKQLVEVQFNQAKALEEVRLEMERNERVAKGFGDVISSAFANAVVEGRNLSDVLSNLGKDIERLLFKEFVGDKISEGVTDFIKDIIPFGGFKAEGGPLQQNKWYIAGEHGPEPIWGGGAGAFAVGYGTQADNGRAGKTTVNVYNNGGSQVDVKESRNGNETRIDIMVDQAVAKNIASPNSRTSRALNNKSNMKMIQR